MGLDSQRPMRAYLEAVRAGSAEASLADLERDLRRQGIFPDGELRLDLDRLALAGLVDELRVPVAGAAKPVERWRLTAAGEELLSRMEAGGPEAPSPDHDVVGDWHRIDRYAYSASCLPASMPRWVVWLAGGSARGLVTAAVYEAALARRNGPPWAVTVRRVRRLYLRPHVVYRAEYGDPHTAAAATAAIDRQLRAGRLPPEVTDAATTTA